MSRLKGAGVGHMIHDDDIQGTGATGLFSSLSLDVTSGIPAGENV
jgi:hypothetical protein